ncbi:uncharacterized protein A4U43_C03F24970 [Asparagus officinalis]|uniref:RRM domain-containing protein n=1 Tax=Asparagus officinalis TaxID=4686 RepID=A0A5P1FCR2_ASPOF|nr:uncharacterized protein A4U43_C03F24970 [Asparagus officinalis]
MAFANKLGSIFKNAINSSPSIYQAIRCMSSSKLFVGGISYGTDDHGLREAFAKYGEVVESRVIFDRETGRSRGFGFVTFTSTEEASAAISDMDGKEVYVNFSSGVYIDPYGSSSAGGGFGKEDSFLDDVKDDDDADDYAKRS